MIAAVVAGIAAVYPSERTTRQILVGRGDHVRQYGNFAVYPFFGR